MSSTLCDQIEEMYNNATGLTDHQTVVVKLKKLDNFHGPGRWICNNSLLDDSNSSYRIETFWTFWQTKKRDHDSLLSWWEMENTNLKKSLETMGEKNQILRNITEYFFKNVTTNR